MCCGPSVLGCVGSVLSPISILGHVVFGASGGIHLWEKKSVYHQRQHEAHDLSARHSSDDWLKYVEPM